MKNFTPIALFSVILFFAVDSFASSDLKTNATLPGGNIFSSHSFSSSYFLGSSVNGYFSSPVHRPKGDAGGDAFSKGKVVISAGYGFPNFWKAVITAIINGSTSTNVSPTGMGPIHFRAEYGLGDRVGLVASVNYVSFGAKWTSYNDTSLKFYDNKISSSSVSILARLNFHFGVTEKLDPYFGIGAGYKSRTWSFTSDDPNYASKLKGNGFSPFGFETTIGMRYYFTEGFGIYTELGIAKSVIQGGLVVAL